MADDHRIHERTYAEIGTLITSLLADRDRWRNVAHNLADALRTYEAVDGIGVGIAALSDYEEATRDA